MKNDFHRQIVKSAPFGYAHHEIILDDAGKPFDYRFIDVNAAFEKHTGLKNENLIGSTVRQVLPGIDKDEFDWIGIYGKIALNGGALEIEQYSQPFNRWYRIHVFSTEKMFFTTFFCDITTEKLAEQNRQREKQTIENYLNTTETIMVSLDDSGIITMLNRHGLELLGYKAGEIIGKNWFETVLPQPEGMNVVFPVFQRIINGDLESVKEFENEVLTRTGERHTIAWRNSYQLDDSGNITGTLSSGLDITERKQHEKAQRESEIRFTTFFQASPAAMAFTRLSDNRLVEVNAAWEGITGFTRQEAIGHTIAELNIWVNTEQQSQMISEIGAKGKSRQDVLLRQKSGEIRDLLMSSEKIELSGEFYLLSSAQDITEHRNAEKALLKSEQHAHALISAIPDMIFRMNTEGVFLDYKAAKEDLYLSPELFLGKNISEIMPGWFAKLALDKISTTISCGEIIIFEYNLPIPEKGDTHFECRMVPYSGNEVLAIVRNISERKEFERQTRESEERFRKIFEDNPLGIALVRNDFMFIRANNVFCSMVGISNDELNTLTFKNITHPDNILNDMQGIRNLMSGESQVYKTENKFIRKDNSIVWANANISVIRDRNGNFLYFLAIIEDITERKLTVEALKNSEEKYRTLFENMSQGVFYQAANGHIIDTNDSALRMFGLSRDQFIGKTSFDSWWRVINENYEVLPPEKYPSMLALQTGKPVTNRTIGVFIPEIEKYNWLIIDAIPQFHPGETSPYQVFASMQDITLRKKAEELLRINEDRLSKSMLATNEGIWDWELVTGEVYFDPRYYTLGGYEVNEFPHRLDEFKKRVHPEDIDDLMQATENHLKGLSDRFQHEFRFRKKDDEYMWILGRGIIVERDENGIPVRFVGTHQDISELKQIRLIDECRLRLLLFAETHTMPELLEETLNEAEKLTDSRIGFYHFIEDDQVTIHLQNWSTQTKATYCRAEGYDLRYHLSQAGVWTDCIKERKPVVHNDYASLPHRKGLPEGHAEVIRELVVPVMRGKKITAILGIGNKPNNYTQQDITSVAKLADLAWDIAEKKLSAEALKKSESSLKELNATKDKFFSIIAHDLKSPFNNIIGFSDLLKEEVRSLDVKDIENYATIISSAANQTLQLLDNLLHWAMMQQGRMDFELRNLLLREITSEVFDLLTEAAKQKTILLNNNIPEMTIINADENMIKTTIRNLVSNALKFTRSGGSVEITAKFIENEILVSVTDTGVGISQENIGKLFNVGSSFSTRGTDNEKGTGLGLILCKEFIEKHGGRIWVESEVGKGSKFSFAIPKTNL